ncbi:hypothetical protein FraEuI1c_0238 [Pseudofrankia inefficax]|uniref:Uncharacterized protein n=1 Tax=Pseudofrankia inefficax (strain DSM 45817 / CECT 9037 / DDB 130130 / EuI1c) TaxID=298654 RepID=E3J633_PSEI1|nr:hypothetical protein FraEuI1c_0238 [Pseudofrankia inefficax]
MGAPVHVASLADGSGALFAPVLPVDLPPDEAGLLTRSERSAAAGGASGWEFAPARRAGLMRLAVERAGVPGVSSVVVCPAGMPVERTALALAVGEILRTRRPGGAAVVTCAAVPAWLGVDRSAVVHPVLVRAGTQAVTSRHVEYPVVVVPGDVGRKGRVGAVPGGGRDLLARD